MNSNHEPIKAIRRPALFAAAVIPFLVPSPANADLFSFCGMRSDFARTPRLTILGLTADQRLVRFKECEPRRLSEIGTVFGLQDDDTTLVGIDFRVQDGELYGLGDGGGIYTLDTSTAEAKVTELTVDLQGDFFGVDFNLAANALRIISDTGQNLRHPFAGPLQFQTQTDTPLNYTPGTNATGVTGAAYTNNDLAASTNTTLFDIDTMLDQVSIQSPPNNGSLAPTGPLTLDADNSVGFDIYTQLPRAWLSPTMPSRRWSSVARRASTAWTCSPAPQASSADSPVPGTTSGIRSSTSRFRSNSKRDPPASGTLTRPGALHAPGRWLWGDGSTPILRRCPAIGQHFYSAAWWIGVGSGSARACGAGPRLRASSV
jgi:hypothetical protein